MTGLYTNKIDLIWFDLFPKKKIFLVWSFSVFGFMFQAVCCITIFPVTLHLNFQHKIKLLPCVFQAWLPVIQKSIPHQFFTTGVAVNLAAPTTTVPELILASYFLGVLSPACQMKNFLIYTGALAHIIFFCITLPTLVRNTLIINYLKNTSCQLCLFHWQMPSPDSQ